MSVSNFMLFEPPHDHERYEAWIIPSVLYTNIGMYILSLLFNPLKVGFSFNPLTFLTPNTRSLILLGAAGTLPINRFGRWWTLIAANFLHGGILHIFFNMLVFYQIAPLIIRQFGGWRMIIIYFVSGVIGFWTSYMAGVSLTIGASAAICGLMGAAIYYGKQRNDAYGRMIFGQMASWAVCLAVFGFLVPGIDNWGHAGGIVAGAACAAMLGYHEKSRQNTLHRVLGIGCVVITASVLLWAVISGVYLRMQI